MSNYVQCSNVWKVKEMEREEKYQAWERTTFSSMLSLFWKKSICRNRWGWQGATLDKLAKRAAGNFVTCFYFHLFAFTTQQILRYGLHTHKFCMNRYLLERAHIRWYWCQCWVEWWICSNKNFSGVFRYLILFVFISHRFFGASAGLSLSFEAGVAY